MHIRQLGQWSAGNWFVLAAPVLGFAAWLIARSVSWTDDARMTEAALLVDATITLPVLYALCYGRSLPLWQVAVRMVGIACLGTYLLSFIIPAEAQLLLPHFAWARTVGMALLLLIELRLFIAGVRLLFKEGVTSEQLSAETGAPRPLAKLMLLEARMWKGLARYFRRR